MAAGRRLGATSALTLLEVLVVPLRAGNARLAAAYQEILSRGRGLRLVLRAGHPGPRTPARLRSVRRRGSGAG